MKTDSTLTVDRLRKLLDYDSETGVFRWKVRASQRITVGDVAGCRKMPAGYCVIRIDGHLHKAHRLAWMHFFGAWPSTNIDHRNENGFDNRIANLREATHLENGQNISRPNRNNSHGLRGVVANGNRWQAKISVAGHSHCLGTFATPEQAHAAYLAAKNRLHPFWASRTSTEGQS